MCMLNFESDVVNRSDIVIKILNEYGKYPWDVLIVIKEKKNDILLFQHTYAGLIYS